MSELIADIQAFANDWPLMVEKHGPTCARSQFRALIEACRRRGYHTTDSYPDCTPIVSFLPNPPPLGTPTPSE